MLNFWKCILFLPRYNLSMFGWKQWTFLCELYLDCNEKLVHPELLLPMFNTMGNIMESVCCNRPAYYIVLS